MPEQYTEVEYTPDLLPSELEDAFMCYNFHCHTTEASTALRETIEDSLMHVALGIGINEEPPLKEYAICGIGYSVTIFIDSSEYTRKNHIGDLIEETVGMWNTAAITIGYFNDMNGDAYTFTYDHRETLYLTSYFTGEKGYRGWDTATAATPFFRSRLYWQDSHPGQMYHLMWPATEHEDIQDVLDVRPEDWIETGEKLRNLLKTHDK